jgi:ribulose-phosphate 3-epimerase
MGDDKRILINPSILNANFDDLEKEISKVSAVSDAIHLDIMDNKFVPNFTFDLERAIEIINFSKLAIDAHLMIEDPDNIAPKYAQAGCDSVSFHFEAVKNCRQTIADIKSNGAKVGIAIKPNTPFSMVEEFVGDIDMFVIMTVEPGFGGQAFMSDQMSKVTQARTKINSRKGESVLLQVDGGISLSTIAQAATAGANCFVAGSAVYKDVDPAHMVVNLRKVAEENLRF